jgi:hypothetical protein
LKDGVPVLKRVVPGGLTCAVVIVVAGLSAAVVLVVKVAVGVDEAWLAACFANSSFFFCPTPNVPA